MGGEMTPGGSHLRGTRSMHEGDGTMAQRSQNLWSVTGAQDRAIFVKGDVADVVGGMLDTPMPSYERT